MNKEKLKNLLIVLCVFILGIATIVYQKYLKPLPEEWIEVQLDQRQNQLKPLEIVVHVSGAVIKPGLYTYTKPMRVVEVLNEAGGLLRDANTDRVNLAKFIYDGQHIHVPFIKTNSKRR